jgi:hypothetical protein
VTKSATVRVAAALATLSLSGSAWAAAGPIAEKTFTLSAERLTGIFHASAQVEPAPTVGVTTIALFGSQTFASNSFLRNVYQMPRIGFDYFIINGLSLGGSFVVWTASTDNSSVTDIVLAPRVGYAYMFSDVVGIWPRGGFSWAHGSIDPDATQEQFSNHFFALDIDVPLVIAPTPGFAITVGPLFDLTFGGSATHKLANGLETTVDASITQFGLSAGVMGVF